MGMKVIKPRILIIMLGLALGACGGNNDNGKTIDTTSGESLQNSLQVMSGGMSEERKVIFARDLNTIFESILASGAVDQEHLFSNDNAWILDESPDPVTNAKFTRLVQKGRSTLEGLSAKKTAALATDARSHWFGVTGDQIVRAQKNAEREWNSYPSMILKVSENYERISARVNVANERHKKAFKNYDVSNLAIGKNLRLTATGRFEVKNVFDKPAIRINYLHRFALADVPGHRVRIETNFPLEDNPIQPGETRTVPFKISSIALTAVRRDAEADEVQFNDMVGPHKAVQLKGHLTGFVYKGEFQDEFYAVGANLEDLAYMENYDDLLARCVSNQAAVQKYYDDLGKLIPLLKDLKEKPKAVNIEFPENLAKKGRDGYYCNTIAPY